MDSADLIGAIGPVLLSWLIAFLPILGGNIIESRAQEIANALVEGGAPPASAAEAAGEIISLAKGASLVGGATAMIAIYVYSSFVFLEKLHSLAWTVGITVWGTVAVLYFGQTAISFRPYEWDQVYVLKPWRRWTSKATFGFTHYDLISALIVISGMILVAGAIATYSPKSAEETPTAALPNDA